MANLKHTIVSMIAVVMISSLVAVQASEISSDAGKIDSRAKNTQVVNVTNENNEESDDTAALNDTVVETQNNTQEAEKTPVEENAQQPVAEGTKAYVLVKDSSLNVRESASTDSEVVDKLACYDEVTILADEGDWYKVSYGSEGKTGYVAKASVTMSAEEAKQMALSTTMYEKGKAVVSDGALNIRAGASTDTEVIDQLDNDETVVIVERQGEWIKILYGRDYKEGYVIASSVVTDGIILRDAIAIQRSDRIAQKAQSKGVITISSGAVNVRSAANENADVLVQLDNNDKVYIMSKDNGWTKIAFGSENTIGYVKSEYVVDPDAPKVTPTRTAITTSRASTPKANTSIKSTNTEKSTKTEKTTAKKVVDSAPATGSTKGQALVNEAEKYIGTKYVYGGSSPSGFDCSGLVQYVCRKQGISVGRSSRDQFNNGVAVSKENLQPGDLVFFQRGGRISHVGIYAGNGQMIHSPQTGKTVCYTSIESASRQKSYAGARRVS